MRRVEGKVAIVTGASNESGLGFAAARALVQEGASVVLTGTNESAVSARAKELVALGGRALGIRQDVTSEEEWQETIERTVETFGRLDILVNNAGIAASYKLEEIELSTWMRILNVNLTGAFLGCKHAVKQMKKQATGGSVINVSSTGGLVGFQKGASYASSKGGMRQLSKVVAIEGAAENIRCNTVFPGVILTDIFKPYLRDNPRHFDGHLARIPMRRLGEPEDVARCILFLASDEAKYVTGAELVVDGGLTAQ